MKRYPKEINNILEENPDKDDFIASIEYCDKWFKKIKSSSANKSNKLNKLIVDLIQETDLSYGSNKKFIEFDLNKKVEQQRRSKAKNTDDGGGKNKKKTQKRKQPTTSSSSSEDESESSMDEEEEEDDDECPDNSIINEEDECPDNSMNEENGPDNSIEEEPKQDAIVPETNNNNETNNDNNVDDDSTIDLFGMAIQYNCSFGCRFRCTSQERLKNHELLFHSDKIKIHKCSFKDCGGQFRSIYDLEKHMMRIHEIFKCSFGKCEKEFVNE